MNDGGGGGEPFFSGSIPHGGVIFSFSFSFPFLFLTGERGVLFSLLYCWQPQL